MATLKRMTVDIRAVIDNAQDEAARRHGHFVDVEHVALGLLQRKGGPAYDALRQQAIDPQTLYDEIAQAVGMERSNPVAAKDFTKAAKALFDRAATEASALGQDNLNGGHVLLALLTEPYGSVPEVLNATGVDAGAVRDHLRSYGDVAQPLAVPTLDQQRTAATSAPRGFAPIPRARTSGPKPGQKTEFVLIPTRTGEKRKRGTTTQRQGKNWPLILGALGLFLAYLVAVLPGSALFTFVLVIIGWVFSVSLHEFSHALVAYLGGDYTVKDKGYLTFNPLKYTHPMLSIGLPLLFLAMGGIGLPGGAVYIERHRLRSKWWGAAVSAAGPLSNLLLALVLSLPFILGLVDVNVIAVDLRWGLQPEHPTFWQNSTLWTAMAFLIMLQITAVVFNLLPFPPLDGFGIIEPLLDGRTAAQLRQFGGYALLIIFLVLWMPQLNGPFWDMIYSVCADLKIPDWLISEGFQGFMFWRTPQ